MKSVFAITTTTEKLTADNGKATMVFTVTNTSSESIRGVAKIKPLENTQRDWLELEGKSERDFSANGTQQFTVNFNKLNTEEAAKESHKAESFPFRLDVISSINPDEDFTEGPVVNIEIPEKKAEEQKPFPIWIPIVAGVLLLAIIGGVVFYLVTRDSKVPVPNVIGMSFTDAEQKLTQSNLLAEKLEDEGDRNSKVDIVFDQNPKEGQVEPNSTIVLKIPTTTTVPYVIGKNLNDAMKLVQNAGLKVGTVSIEKNTAANKVTLQSPQGNNRTRVVKNTEVNLALCVKSKTISCVTIKPGFTNIRELDIKPIVKENFMKSIDKSVLDKTIKH